MSSHFLLEHIITGGFRWFDLSTGRRSQFFSSRLAARMALNMGRVEWMD